MWFFAAMGTGASKGNNAQAANNDLVEELEDAKLDEEYESQLEEKRKQVRMENIIFNLLLY